MEKSAMCYEATFNTNISEGAIKGWDEEGSGGMRNCRDGQGGRRKHGVEKNVTMETEKGRDDRTFKNYFPIVRKLKNKSGKSTWGIKVQR